jgi:sulfofructose kinase
MKVVDPCGHGLRRRSFAEDRRPSAACSQCPFLSVGGGAKEYENTSGAAAKDPGCNITGMPDVEKVARVDLVGVGLNATDTVVPLRRFPVPGSKTEYVERQTLLGGEVATASIACQTWGLRTRYVGRLGDDRAARLHREAFERAGVEAKLITVPNAHSPESLILVDESGERTVLCHRDTRLTLQPEDLQRDWVESARALLVDGYHTQAAITAARWARQAGIPVVADLDVIRAELSELLPLVDYALVSLDFPAALTGERDLDKAMRTIHQQYGCGVVGVTLGLNGVVAWDGDTMLRVPAFRVKTIDSTGAGDLFHAGFLYGLLQGYELPQRLEFGCAAAALNCTHIGARGFIAPLEDIEALIRKDERHPMSAPGL